MRARFEEARAAVAEQVAQVVEELPTSGSRGLVVQRVQDLSRAYAAADRVVIRSAAVDLIEATAALVVALDLAPGNPWR